MNWDINKCQNQEKLLKQKLESINKIDQIKKNKKIYCIYLITNFALFRYKINFVIFYFLLNTTFIE